MPPPQATTGCIICPKGSIYQTPHFLFCLCVCVCLCVCCLHTCLPPADTGSLYRDCFTSHMPGELVCKPSFHAESGFQLWSTGSQSSTLSTERLPGWAHSHFLEEVPVSDDLELLQDEEDATADEESLVLCQRLIEQQQIALTGRGETPHRHRGPQREVNMVSGTCVQSLLASLKQCRGQTYLTALVTSENCMRWYFLRSSMVGM